jgi:hypothetical protein
MINITDYTVNQLLLAAGISRGMKRSLLVRTIKLSESYYTKQMKNNNFLKLIQAIKLMPLDKDMIEYKNIGTLQKMIGKFIYSTGENHEGQV